ncbi:hypothetical protein ACM26V_10445 [Salipaludibacillus sp. HK11]|uniref:hypothetical protein n=1 Tax=Salipaludibacillus sp. HK11 TaxID=3394320 RepID=UPI0039FCACED
MRKEKEVLVRLDGKYKRIQDHLIKPERQEKIETQLVKDDDSQQNEEQKVIDFNKRRKLYEEENAPFWDDGRSERSPKLPPSKRKNNKQSWDKFSLDYFKNKVFLSVSAAILVGGAFGMMLLSLFTGNDTTVGQDQAVTSNEIGISDSAVGVANGQSPSNLSSLDAHVVQAGAFSTIEKGEEMATLIKEKGFPSLLFENDGTHFLFVGMGLAREEAEVLANHIEDQGQETYVKPFEILNDQIEVPEDIHTFVTKGVNWMAHASNIAVQDIVGEAPSDEAVTELFDAGQAWQDAYDEMDTTNEEIAALSSQWMDASQSVMAVYSSNLSTTEFAWEMQESLLNGLIIYQQLIVTLEKA